MLRFNSSPVRHASWLVAAVVGISFWAGGCGHEHHDDGYYGDRQAGYYYDRDHHDWDHDHDRDRDYDRHY
ncbi:MAG TPA: hypothetical protein VLJ39_14795 [Tepidisphaeraceae bacterium]|nr:hypothetical protein [Tepidisphaeraceae bacterium]